MQTPLQTLGTMSNPPSSGEFSDAETLQRRRLPVEFVFLVFGIIILNHWLTATVLDLLQSIPTFEHFAPWVLLFAGASGFLVAATHLHQRRHDHDKQSSRLVWLVVLALTCGDACGLAIHDLTTNFSLPACSKIFAFLVGIPALAATVQKLHDWKHKWSRLVTIKRKLSSEYVKGAPIRQLALFVSPPSIVPDVQEDSNGVWITFPRKKLDTIKPPDNLDKDSDPITLSGDLGNDIPEMNKLGLHGWQQLLRAISPHRDNLTRVFLLGSPDTTGQRKVPRNAGEKAKFEEGSALYLPLCQKFLKRYLPKAEVKMVDAVDFEDSKELERLLWELQETAAKESGPAGFAIDVTGGQKINSVVAAGVTLLSGSVVQYVQTAPRSLKAVNTEASKPTIEAYIYDLRFDLPADIG